MGMVKYKQDDRVFHNHFGLGTVTEVVANDRVKVYFARMGEKTLDLNYAPLRLGTSEDDGFLAADIVTGTAFAARQIIMLRRCGTESLMPLQ